MDWLIVSHGNFWYVHYNSYTEEGINQGFKLKFAQQVPIYLFHVYMSACVYMCVLRSEAKLGVILQAALT